jgi:hypothetical protein
MTSQERELILNEPVDLKDFKDDTFEVTYRKDPQKEFCKDWAKELKRKNLNRIIEQSFPDGRDKNSDQLTLF